MLAARASGAAAIAVTDPVPAKRALALELVADLAVDPTDRAAVAEIRGGPTCDPPRLAVVAVSLGTTGGTLQRDARELARGHA